MRMNRFSGLFGFSVVAFGQVVSLLGSSMTGFALMIWAWRITGQATALGLVGFAGLFPLVILSPIAGALVDRWNRKLVMILSDLAAGIGTVALFILLSLDALEIWHIYIVAAFSGAFQAFQFPAYSASITLMVPKEHLGRANAMLGIARSIPSIFAPMAAGALIGFIEIKGIMLIDIVTFTFAIGALLLVRVPQPKKDPSQSVERPSLLSDSLYGFRYIFERPGLAGLLLYFLLVNFLLTFAFGVLSPMVLARTGSNQVALGAVQMVFGIGGVLGGVLVSIWGGPKRRILGLLMSVFFGVLFGNAFLGVGRSILVWSIGAFVLSSLIPIASTSSQSIWQAKVPPGIQGRVFSARIMLGQIGSAVALPLAGLLADYVFEPLMLNPSAISRALSYIVGTGPGSGMGLMFLLFGLLGIAATVGVYFYRPVRNVETLLPDCEPEAEAAPSAGG